MIGNVIGLDVNPETGDQLFGYTGVTERCDYARATRFCECRSLPTRFLSRLVRNF